MGGVGVELHLFLTWTLHRSCKTQLCVLYSWGKTPSNPDKEAERTSDQVCTLWSREKSLLKSGIELRILGIQPVA